VGFLLVTHWPALTLAFIGDDYLILDRTISQPFWSLLSFDNVIFNWYRPISRELYYWSMEQLFGLSPLPYHLVSFALWGVVMALYVLLVARMAGLHVAALSAAGVAAMASWGAPLYWVAGVQELWMLFFSFLFLHAFARRADLLAGVVLLAALLSKETAGMLPLLAFLWSRLVSREPVPTSVRRVLPLMLLVGSWALLHPRLMGRLFGPYIDTTETVGRPGQTLILVKSLLALINLDEWPAPESGFERVILAGLPGMCLLFALALWASRPRSATAHPLESSVAHAQRSDVSSPRINSFAASWAILGTLPLFLPSIGWHAYYGLFGAFGAWFLGANALASRPMLLLPLICVAAFIGPLRADTPSWDWSSIAYQRRASFFVTRLRDDLLLQRPSVPSHSRFYFGQVPRNIGWISGDGPALRLWYRDSTLEGGYYSYYRPRTEDQHPGPDLFFRCDSTRIAWMEVVKGPEDIRRGHQQDPNWEANHRELALLLGHARDWEGAALELLKLHKAFPENVEYPLNLGQCYERAGKYSEAAEWYRKAAVYPGTDSGVLELIRRVEDSKSR
jgi:hypothetical protein